MVGLPCSGKTTLATSLERQHGALRLTKDDWMMPLFGWGEFEDERPIVEDLLWAVGARALTLGVDVVLDYGLRARAERDDYRARAAALGARVDMRFLDVPDDELFRRLESRRAAPGRRTCRSHVSNWPAGSRASNDPVRRRSALGARSDPPAGTTRGPDSSGSGPLALVAGAGFEPTTSGL